MQCNQNITGPRRWWVLQWKWWWQRLCAKKRGIALTSRAFPDLLSLSFLPSHCATIHWAVQTLERKTPTQIIHEPKYDAVLLLGKVLECVAKDVFFCWSISFEPAACHFMFYYRDSLIWSFVKVSDKWTCLVRPPSGFYCIGFPMMVILITKHYSWCMM